MESKNIINEANNINNFLFKKLRLNESQTQVINSEIKKITKFFPSGAVIDLNLSRVDSSSFWAEIVINFNNECFVASALSSRIPNLMAKVSKEALKQSLRWRNEVGRLNLKQYDKNLGATYFQ